MEDRRELERRKKLEEEQRDYFIQQVLDAAQISPSHELYPTLVQQIKNTFAHDALAHTRYLKDIFGDTAPVTNFIAALQSEAKLDLVESFGEFRNTDAVQLLVRNQNAMLLERDKKQGALAAKFKENEVALYRLQDLIGAVQSTYTTEEGNKGDYQQVIADLVKAASVHRGNVQAEARMNLTPEEKAGYVAAKYIDLIDQLTKHFEDQQNKFAGRGLFGKDPKKFGASLNSHLLGRRHHHFSRSIGLALQIALQEMPEHIKEQIHKQNPALEQRIARIQANVNAIEPREDYSPQLNPNTTTSKPNRKSS